MMVMILAIGIVLIMIIAGAVASSTRNGKSGLKLMLMGIEVTVIGGILAFIGGLGIAGVTVIFVGLIISLAGFMRDDE